VPYAGVEAERFAAAAPALTASLRWAVESTLSIRLTILPNAGANNRNFKDILIPAAGQALIRRPSSLVMINPNAL